MDKHDFLGSAARAAALPAGADAAWQAGMQAQNPETVVCPRFSETGDMN
jgi:hypothetical protein